MSRPPSGAASTWRWWAATVLAVVSVLAACGAEESAASLSAAAARGRAISSNNGCAACHGVDGQGGVGPPFVGLPGSEVELIDGTSVVADDDYLVRAIVDPGAELRAGFDVQMPNNRLDDSEVADVIAYIKELGPAAAGG